MPNINDKVTLFTAAMRTEFMSAYDGLRPIQAAPWTNFVTRIGSTARIEQYPWMSAPPRLKRWLGKRNYTRPDYSKYKVENLEYSAEEAVLLRDIEDDQTGGFGARMTQMAKDITDFPGREAIKILAANGACFDGSNFFADSHTVGVGDNNLTIDNASNDGLTHKVIALYIGGTLKPIIWQDRKDKGLQDNSDTKQSLEEKQVKFWYDVEGAAGFGFWWDAVYTAVTDTPTVNEVETIIINTEKAFRGFKLDAADPSEDAWYMHEQNAFAPGTLLYIVNPSLENLFRTVLTAENLQAGTSGGTKTNIFRGHGDLVISGYLGA